VPGGVVELLLRLRSKLGLLIETELLAQTLPFFGEVPDRSFPESSATILSE
jgi:hypothetical protein